MANELRCPSCAHVNEPDAAICSQCNFPLREGAPEPVTPVPTGSAPEAMPEIDIRRIRPIRPRRPADSQQQLLLQS